MKKIKETYLNVLTKIEPDFQEFVVPNTDSSKQTPLNYKWNSSIIITTEWTVMTSEPRILSRTLYHTWVI